MKKLLLLAVLATSAHAQSITLCANKTNGNLFFRSKCFSSENKITNLSALKGATGATGPAGASGANFAECHSIHQNIYYESAADPQDPTQTFSMFDILLSCPAGEFLQSHVGASNGDADVARPTLQYPQGDITKVPNGVMYSAFTSRPGSQGGPIGISGSAVCCPLQ